MLMCMFDHNQAELEWNSYYCMVCFSSDTAQEKDKSLMKNHRKQKGHKVIIMKNRPHLNEASLPNL